MTSKALAERAMSAFPVSIGTSLALESIFPPRQPAYDESRVIPNKIEITKYQEFWININTLFRNFIGSIDKNTFLTTSPGEMAQVLYGEIGVIKSLLTVEGKGVCRAVFYACTYDKQYKGHQHKAVMFRHDNTDYQKAVAAAYMKVVGYLAKMDDSVKLLDDTLTPDKKIKALILTHYPYDLVSAHNFDKLDLIESNTGKLKTRAQWWTKYYKLPGAELNTLPFNDKLLKIFGDHVMFQPMDIRFRRMIYDVSVQRRWTPFTTIAKMNMDVELTFKDKFMAMVFRDI